MYASGYNLYTGDVYPSVNAPLVMRLPLLYQDESLGGWRVKRTIDGVDKADYRLDQNYVLRAGAKAKVTRRSSFTKTLVKC